MGVVGAGREVVGAHDDEADAGRPFEALVGRRREARQRQPREIDGNAAEGAHGVHVQAAPGFAHGRGEIGERVEDAGRGLAMDQRDIGDIGLGREPPGKRRRPLGRLGLAGFQHAVGAARAAADLRHPPAVGAVDENQQPAVARDQRAELGFHREGAAALHRHAGEGLAGVGEREQAPAHARGELDERGIARAPVAVHGRTGLGPGGERAGGKQDGFGARCRLRRQRAAARPRASRASGVSTSMVTE